MRCFISTLMINFRHPNQVLINNFRINIISSSAKYIISKKKNNTRLNVLEKLSISRSINSNIEWVKFSLCSSSSSSLSSVQRKKKVTNQCHKVPDNFSNIPKRRCSLLFHSVNQSIQMTLASRSSISIHNAILFRKQQ